MTDTPTKILISGNGWAVIQNPDGSIVGVGGAGSYYQPQPMEKKIMAKYYRVKKSNFLWQEGAIICNTANDKGGYIPIEDVWNTTPVNDAEYISAKIIEHPNNAEFFERVYKDDVTGKLFRTADQIKDAYNKAFKE